MKKWKILKFVGIPVAVLVILICGALAYYSIREYHPEPKETLTVYEEQDKAMLDLKDPLRILSYNIGYGGLGESADFFMDGGSGVNPPEKEVVEKNIQGVLNTLKENPVDIYLLQEIDVNSKRSFYTNEFEVFKNELQMNGSFAYNYKCDYVPYPIPPLGKIESGLATFTNKEVREAQRISLPNPFSWPVRTCNLKRCLMIFRLPIQGSEKELVLVNLHLEAYDNGEGKIAQTKLLSNMLQEEYEKGNYVIAGGDFNQTFEGVEGYPILHAESWVPGALKQTDIPTGFSFVVADNLPTCRTLDAPYKEGTTQTYVIDGFIVSDNIKTNSVSVLDTNFQYADHQPILLEVSFE